MPTLYRFMSEMNAIKSLEQLRLRVGRLSQLNDPFDCSFVISGANAREKIIGSQIAERLLRDRVEKLGLLAFSRTWKEPVLWSHYGDSHRGIVLVFKLPKDDNLFRVVYERQRKKLSYDMLDDPAMEHEVVLALTETFTKKAPSWRYEKETRILPELAKCEIAGGDYYSAIPKQTLAGVILGLRCPCPPAYITKIFENHGLKKATVWRAVRHASQYSLDRELTY